MAMLFCYGIAGAISVPAHNYASGYLGGTPYHSHWYMNAYLIPMSLTLIFVGNLTKKFGRKTMATYAPAVFVIGLIGSALAVDSLVFIGCRMIQGISAAVCGGLAGGYLNGGIGKTHRDVGKGLFVVTFVFAGTLGVAYGGAISWHLSWRLVYASLALIQFASWILIFRYLPQDEGDKNMHLDWSTFILCSIGFGTFSISLIYGNQHEWLESNTYITLSAVSIVALVLFLIRFSSSPPLLNPKVFSDINFVISSINISVIMFSVYLIFAILPGFMIDATQNTIMTYSGPFFLFSAASTITVYLFAPGINTHYLARTVKARRVMSSLGVTGFGLTSIWMAQTSSAQSNQTITIQLIFLGISFGFFFHEFLMAFATVPAELATTASSIALFGGNLAKVFGGALSGSINTLSTQGSWERFRNHISQTSIGLENFQGPLQNQMIEGIHAQNWNQASLDIINHSLAQQAAVVSYINQATLTGCLLICFGVLPFLHREQQDKK
jgi:DHA2 family multidrug resistance protein